MPSVPTSHASPKTFRIGPAGADDLDALVALEQASFEGDRLSRRQWRQHLRSETVTLRVARCGATLAGAALVFHRRGSRVARLYSLAVAEAFRGQGMAAALLDAVEAEAAARQCTLMRLEVRVDNSAAQRLYAARGYHNIGRYRAYYEDGADALRLDKRLAPEALSAGASRVRNRRA